MTFGLGTAQLGGRFVHKFNKKFSFSFSVFPAGESINAIFLLIK